MHYNRKMIVRDFEAFGHDGDEMKEVYGDIMDRNVRTLLVAIHTRHMQQKAEQERRQIEARTVKHGEGEETNQEGVEVQGPDNSLVVPRIDYWKQAIEQW